MQHFADFGITRTVNRLKKKQFQLDQGNKNYLNNTGYDIETHQKVMGGWADDTPMYLARQSMYWDGNKYKNDNPKAKVYMPSEKYSTSKRIPISEGFTDIRKVSDTAASPTGYLGFRKDPFKGFGGMMEEPVPTIKSGIKIKRPVPQFTLE
jgi:hypothetical protein